MKTYLVGGAVRDTLLKLEVQDHDWVVVGATAQDLLAQGFTPVGKDFPVFLHPKTHEEYALARTERKVSQGYKGFSVNATTDVTLKEDLARRDLTINAMAMTETGEIIDPYGGQEDLKNKILRHVSDAFSEDPVRILRVARFAARYGFNIAPETLSLMQKMSENGEVQALTPERVWQEIAKGLMEKTPSFMIEALRRSHALVKILPEVAALFGVPQRSDYHPEIDTGIHTLMVLDQAAKMNLGLAERFAALTHDLGKALTPATVLPSHHGHDQRGLMPLKTLCSRLKVPNNCADLAYIVTQEHIKIHNVAQLKALTALNILLKCDAIRRPQRFESLLNVCHADIQGRLNLQDTPYPQKQHWLALLQAALTIDAEQIANATADKSTIAAQIFQARLKKVQAIHTQLKDQK